METVYKRAVGKRRSSSSDDTGQDTSDELLDIEFAQIQLNNRGCDSDDMIVGDEASVQQWRRGESQPRPSTSRGTPPHNYQRPIARPAPREPTLEQIAEKFIRESEQGQAEIFPLPGNDMMNLQKNVCRTVVIDETYMVVGGQVDECTMVKIQKGGM